MEEEAIMKLFLQFLKHRTIETLLGVSILLAWLLTTATPAQAAAFEEYLEDIYQIFSSYVGDVGAPKFFESFFDIMGQEMPAQGEMASATENGLEDSYAIREDVADAQERLGVQVYLNRENLSEEAQEITQQTREQSIKAVDDSQNLAEDSQDLDTSQQILQNISAQLGQQALISNLGFQEISKTRTELAMSAVLLAQSTKELNQLTTAQRQEMITSRNQAVANAGLISMPGSPVIDVN